MGDPQLKQIAEQEKLQALDAFDKQAAEKQDLVR